MHPVGIVGNCWGEQGCQRCEVCWLPFPGFYSRVDLGLGASNWLGCGGRKAVSVVMCVGCPSLVFTFGSALGWEHLSGWDAGGRKGVSVVRCVGCPSQVFTVGSA
ncbi:hypothetical protein [Rubritalea tangerina]|uniref:hypothetical protein n=1 Tax=Rubritalea tangerina TaxID=430798 RepID=UPI00360742FB